MISLSIMAEEENTKPVNFIRHIINEHNETGRYAGKVATRFPPEPNGFLHIGHAKSICLNFGLAKDYHGTCNLRFDDTNPTKEEDLYVKSIMDDVRWLGFDWGDRLFHASDYFENLYQCAVKLIQKGKAYVCHLSAEETRATRGTLTESGKESPYRHRSIEENLDLFEKMKRGEFKEGECVLRAKIDMTSGNINLRDPVIYRIMKVSHQRTKDKWCIYPMYDYAHGISDALEGITHSICTLEFQDHRPLYDWFLEVLEFKHRPLQIEFSRLNLNYTVMSKRYIKQMVDEKLVSGWDDPRLPTIQGIRRRGYSPQSLRNFCEIIGVSKKETIIDMTILEDCVRDDLNQNALRAFAVLDPLKIVIENYPEGKSEDIKVPNHPQKPELGHRLLKFSRDIIIEQEDFMENPPKKFFRLSPGNEVRLRYGYIIKCEKVIKDASGKIIELRCSYDPNTLGKDPEGRKVKGIIHWLSLSDSIPAEVNLYDRLFTESDPFAYEDKEFKTFLNPKSLLTITTARIESGLALAPKETRYQFERIGYFVVDYDSTKERPVFNRTVTLRAAF